MNKNIDELNKVILKSNKGETVYFYIDPITLDIYSPKCRKLKCWRAFDGVYYYRIFMDKIKITKCKNSLIKMWKEQYNIKSDIERGVINE